MGTYDTRGGYPISPNVPEPWFPETKQEATDTIVRCLQQAKSGELSEREFERVADEIFEWSSDEFNAEALRRDTE